MRSTGLRLVEVLVVFVGLSLLSYFSLKWAMEGIIHYRREVVVPDLKGKSVQAALDLVSPMNLSLRKESDEFNDGVPIGAILRQAPSAGTTVREGKAIRIVVSQGGETVFVPSLVGLPLRNAELLLRQRQMQLGEVSESYSLRTEKGMVLSQDPKGESSVEKRALVNVVVSAGRPPAGIVLMPDFRQKNVVDAQAWAQGLGVVVKVSTDPTSLFPSGSILTQDPAPDAVVPSGGPVNFLASGRPKVSGGGAAAMKSLHYELPQGSSESLVRIVVIDPYGEREIFNGLRSPGSKIDLAIPDTGASRVRIFVNAVLVEEREL